MKLRSLVPILGVLAAPLFAGESVVTVADGTKLKLSGWVDTTFTASDTTDDKVKATNMDTGFYAKASLKAEVTFEKVRVYTNLWIDPDFAQLQTREAYVALTLPNSLTLTTGKYINHVGWLAAEPTGLFTVNASTIGYTGAYGNDVVGAKLNWASTMIDVQVDINNGYFSLGDEKSRSTAPQGRSRSGLGYGADVVVRPPVDGLSMNVEWAYDQTSGAAAGTTGGDIWQVGFNATYAGKDTKIESLKPITVGLEYIYRKAMGSSTTAGTDITRNQDSAEWNQGMFLINYVLPADKLPFPMALTGMVQYINRATGTTQGVGPTLANETGTSRATEFALALMTNPFKVSNLGVNFEIAWNNKKDVSFSTDQAQGNAVVRTETKSKGPTATVEVFASF